MKWGLKALSGDVGEKSVNSRYIYIPGYSKHKGLCQTYYLHGFKLTYFSVLPFYLLLNLLFIIRNL